MQFFRDRLEEGGEAVIGWYGWYAIRAADAEGPRALVGSGGYFGPPDTTGTAEIGYSVLPEWQRRGYATEIVRALVRRAFTYPYIQRVIAHTLKTNQKSISVLLRAGFQPAGKGEEPESLCFVFQRSQ